MAHCPLEGHYLVPLHYTVGETWRPSQSLVTAMPSFISFMAFLLRWWCSDQ